MTRRRRLAGGRLLRCISAALLLAAAPLRAHDFWIEALPFRPDAPAALPLRLRVGEHFAGDALPRYGPWIRRFVLLGPGGEAAVSGRDGAEPAGTGRIGAPGLYTAVYESNASPATLSAAAFEKYLREEGLDAIAAGRAGAGLSGGPVRERFYRCAKALVLAGPAAGSAGDRAVGLPLELVAEQSPYALRPGAVLGVRLLYEGRPLEGALVVAMSRAAPSEAVRARSDAEGRVRLTLGRPGAWLVKAVHAVPAREGQPADYESFWASLVFELPE
jgi:hypothetical protein